MIQFELFNFIIDWTGFVFQLCFLSVTYPVNGIFRTDSLFAFILDEGEIYLEIFFLTLIGEKRREDE